MVGKKISDGLGPAPGRDDGEGGELSYSQAQMRSVGGQAAAFLSPQNLAAVVSVDTAEKVNE